MVNYYKYLPVSREDEAWGLCVLNAGCSRIPPSVAYPPRDHPSHHYFNWSKGRVLDEYQVIYISRGKGVFESESCRHHVVEEGTVVLLFPGEWHRFKPSEATGWDEYWVGFKGAIVESLVKEHFFSPGTPLLHIGAEEGIVQLLTDIIEATRAEKPGYQPLASGAVLHILGALHSLTRQEHIKKEDAVETVVNRARLLFRSRLDENLSMEGVAGELGVSYSWFRKAFKTYTGLAPNQYLVQLKIERAKQLLSNPLKSIKEIAFELNFESAFYFSKLFREKAGLSPEKYRRSRMPGSA